MFNISSIGQRVGIGFILMLVLLCLVVSIASVGIDYVVDSAGDLLESNKLRADLMQHEIDHLSWENSLHAFLVDGRGQKLTIQLDDRKCEFGKWLYGQQRQLMESRMPELVPLFKAMEEPHQRLHKSAQRISATLGHTDRNEVTNLASHSILRNENIPNHRALQRLLREIRIVVDKNMVTDAKMLSLAQSTRNLIIGISVLALLLAAFMAVRTSREIIMPLNYLTTQLTIDCTKIEAATGRYNLQSNANANQCQVDTKFLKSSHFHNPFNYLKLYSIWRKSNTHNNKNTTHNGILSRITGYTNTAWLFNTTQIPEEVTSLVNAIKHYTECQTRMVTGQQQFIADVAHQLKNPLAGIYIQMDMLVDDSAQHPPEQQSRILKLREAIHRIGRLTHQLLALARCSSDAVGSQAKTIINLQELIEENASIWLDMTLPKQIDLGFELKPITINGVSWLLSEMLHNLVDNAIKYSSINGKITIRCGHRNAITSDYNNRQPFLEVEDNGPGIPEHAKDKIFDRFYRANDVKQNTRDGSVGLGLAIVKEVAKYHDAIIKIHAPSPTITGTKFSIEFPYFKNIA